MPFNCAVLSRRLGLGGGTRMAPEEALGEILQEIGGMHKVKELMKYSVFSDAGLFVEEIRNKTSALLLSEVSVVQNCVADNLRKQLHSDLQSISFSILITDISMKKRQFIMQMHLTTTYEAVNELDFCPLCMGSAILKDSTLSALPLIQNCFFSEENK
ncbi:hypothetical protein Peur_010417 [Populus x canadensis]